MWEKLIYSDVTDQHSNQDLTEELLLSKRKTMDFSYMCRNLNLVYLIDSSQILNKINTP